MYLRDTLLRCAWAGFYLPFWSQEVLDGAIRNLTIREKMPSEKARQLEAKIKAAFPESMIQVPDGLADVMTNHPGDRHVVAAAVTARANIIVTSNLKHFKDKDLKPWNIEAQSPDEFLTDLYNTHQDQIVEVLQRQSQGLEKPPLNLVELLGLLSKEIPVFTNNILLHEYSQSIYQTTNKALNLFGRQGREGGRYLEGERYRLSQNMGILTITAKNNRGKILQFEKGRIQGNLSSADVEAFPKFAQTLEQELETYKIQKSEIL
jgi:hypothetical protein